MRHNNWALLAIAIVTIGLSVTTSDIYADTTGNKTVNRNSFKENNGVIHNVN